MRSYRWLFTVSFWQTESFPDQNPEMLEIIYTHLQNSCPISDACVQSREANWLLVSSVSEQRELLQDKRWQQALQQWGRFMSHHGARGEEEVRKPQSVVSPPHPPQWAEDFTWSWGYRVFNPLVHSASLRREEPSFSVPFFIFNDMLRRAVYIQISPTARFIIAWYDTSKEAPHLTPQGFLKLSGISLILGLLAV